MNDQKLNELLEVKKSAAGKFSTSDTAFAEKILAEIERTPVRRVPVLRLAAGLLIAAGVAVFFAWTAGKQEKTADSPFYKVREAARLFGGDAAVLFFGDELVTGERESADTPVNFVDVKLCGGTKPLELTLACSDSDSIYLDAENISGNLVISRCDAVTLVLDVELKINGREIRTIIPVVRRGKNRYSADGLS